MKSDENIRKPNALLHLIRQQQFAEPEKSKLVSFLQGLRVEKLGPATISAREINEWCHLKEGVPSDLDEAFVLAHHVFAKSFNTDEQDLKVVLSTRRLLANMKKTNLIQADGTFKITWQGYPVLIVGATDSNRLFHPFALAVSKSKSAADFGFLFKSLHTYDLEYQPTILMADGSDAITAGYEEVFGAPFRRLMCFFHVIKNVEQHLRGLTKGNRQVREFVDYFEEQWVRKYPYWFEGAAMKHPSTNNGIESTNAVLKRDYTFHERLPVGQFLNLAADVVQRWSEVRNPLSPNCIHFCIDATPSLAEWTAAYQWKLLNKKVLQRKLVK